MEGGARLANPLDPGLSQQNGVGVGTMNEGLPFFPRVIVCLKIPPFLGKDVLHSACTLRCFGA